MRRPLFAFAVAVVLLVGCGGVPTGPVLPPEYYPDRTTHISALRTYFWAYQEGDVEVLLTVLGAWEYKDLDDQLKAGEKKADLAAWYRQDGADLTIEDVTWKHEGKALAYVQVVLRAAGKRYEKTYSMLRRPDGWVVSGKRALR